MELALGVLELLCTTAEGRAAVANHALAMAALVHHLHTMSNLATELSVAILWSVCKASPACLVLVLLQVSLTFFAECIDIFVLVETCIELCLAA